MVGVAYLLLALRTTKEIAMEETVQSLDPFQNFIAGLMVAHSSSRERRSKTNHNTFYFSSQFILKCKHWLV